MDFPRHRATEIWVFAVLLVCSVYFFPRWADPNQNSRLDTVLAVVDDGTFRIDDYVHNTVDYAQIGDHYYSDKAPGTAFLGIPIYAVLGRSLDLPFMQRMLSALDNNEALAKTLREGGTGLLELKVRLAVAQVALAFVSAVVPTALTGVLLFRLSRRCSGSDVAGVVIALAYGLLTPAFPYANAFVGHQLAAALIFGAFWLTTTMGARSFRGGLLVGGLLGYSVLTEYPSAVAVIVICIYCLARRARPRFLLGVGVSLGICGLVLGFYNYSLFGSPFSLGYSHSTLWTQQHEAGFFSMTSPNLAALWGITFSPYRGLFLLSPWLMIAVPGAAMWWRRQSGRAELVAVAGIVLSFLLFNVSSVMWWGGWSIGPRYLLPMLPFLALLTAPALSSDQWYLVLMLRSGLMWSLVAVWGLSIAGQSFPPDTVPNPWLDYALPHLAEGNIARNMGMMLGLSGWWSLLPLIAFLTLALLVGIMVRHWQAIASGRITQDDASRRNAPAGGASQ